MEQNLGKLDRIFRFLLAFWWLSPTMAPSFSAEWLNIVVAIVGWIALAESFLGWCWLHGIFKIDNTKQ
ncbi:DUF2892 domain-containing protein [Candidatus Microgenomates bacterium]|nr:DUF2892 domain-containing protein [Candidatus Microgenomates bacterium]